MAVWRLQADIGEDDWIDREHQSMWTGFILAAKYVTLKNRIPSHMCERQS